MPTRSMLHHTSKHRHTSYSRMHTKTIEKERKCFIDQRGRAKLTLVDRFARKMMEEAMKA